MWSYSWHCSLIPLHATANIALLLTNGFHYQMTAFSAETVLEVGQRPAGQVHEADGTIRESQALKPCFYDDDHPLKLLVRVHWQFMASKDRHIFSSSDVF